jgi:SAM-dependent methyltransferase
MPASPRNAPLPPSPWIERFAPFAPAGGPVLDLACGGGRHGRLFLERGHPVTFVDRDTAGVQDLAGRADVEIIEADLEAGAPWPLGDRRFAGVVVANYLWRPILAHIIAAVAPGGVLIYETFAQGNEAYGRPRNPDFLLQSGELFEAIRGALRILAYGQHIRESPNAAIIQHIAAARPGGG